MHRHDGVGEVIRDLILRESEVRMTWNLGPSIFLVRKKNWRELTSGPLTGPFFEPIFPICFPILIGKCFPAIFFNSDSYSCNKFSIFLWKTVPALFSTK